MKALLPPIWLLAAAVATKAVLVPNLPGEPAELANSTNVCDRRIVNTNGTCSVLLDGGCISSPPLPLFSTSEYEYPSLYRDPQYKRRRKEW